MHKRVLIVGTVPYDMKESSRAFDAYFHFWEKENLAQIFSNSKEPSKGHCGKLYQITDKSILKRWFNRKIKVGKSFLYDELSDMGLNTEIKENGVIQKAYAFGQKHTPLTHLLRGILWRKCFWCTDELNNWLDEFNPECVFLAFSDDYFIPQIALYVAKRFNVPIVSCIGDDYYFNKHFSLNPFYQLYKETYKCLIRKLFKHPGSAIYISDKIKNKYNSEFNLDGETVYLTSTINRRDFRVINKENPVITYFGNIQMGRNHSLCKIASALGNIDKDYCIHVYSNEPDETIYRILAEHPHIEYGGSIPYQEVKEKMENSDITLIVEGFEDRDIELSRYSLSTKAADALASGVSIFVFGSAECGIIEYMKSTEAAIVCTDEKELILNLKNLIEDAVLQKKLYHQQIVITEKNHNLNRSCNISEQVVDKAIRNNKKMEKNDE